MNTTDRRPLSLAAHAAAEPLLVALYIAGPWIFGFSDTSDAKTISIILGILVALTAFTTRWRMAVARLVPLRMHRAMDLMVAAVAILSPFVFGFSDVGGPTRFLIVMGVLEAGAALMTRWDDRDEFAVTTVDRGRSAAA